MSSSHTISHPPRVAAVLVVHDGVEWLASVLATLANQHYPALDLVVVDNGSRDGSGEVLRRRIPEERLITLPRNVGFARAVAASLTHEAVASADLLLLLHDDLVLAPDAIGHLVAALEADPRLSVVGPKLREWSDDVLLAEVGMTIDRFGRAESPVERGELDQGQHDLQREVLYVSTAGMLLRRELLRELGGLDARFPAYRDDLDFCWRAWLYGHRVEVVPDAVAYHIGAGDRAARRLGRRSFGGRYLAERHSVATLLKNYSILRLLWVLPIVLLLAVAKTVVFVAIRRFGEAGAVVRAYAWNLAQLPRTLRRRRTVQRRRQVRDRELAPLFAPGLPRANAYIEALGAWLAGGSTRALTEDGGGGTSDDGLADSSVLRLVRDRPAAAAGLVLLLAYLAGIAPLLAGGQIVGGQIAPWPRDASDFLVAYLSPWTGEPLGTHGFASPIQALLGLLSFAGFGSQWLAQRLLVFGLLPVAWLVALRAGRLITPRPGPRALGATLYAMSPVLLGALGSGRYGVLFAGTLLPGLVLAGVRAADTRVATTSAWRATALLALGLLISVAAAPTLAPLLGVGLLGGIVLGALRRGAVTWQATTRPLLAAVAASLVLLPWLFTLLASGGPAEMLAPGLDAGPLPMWRAVTAVPDVLPGLGGLAGVLATLTSLAVVVAGVVLGLRRRPVVVAVLAAVGGAAALAAWAVARAGVPWLWPPSLLLPTALALAGMGVVAASSVAGGLRDYTFGARQLSVTVAGVLLVVGLVMGVARLAAGPYDGLTRNPELVPAFVNADVAQVGPYRVLLLADRGEEIHWDVTRAGGPSMLRYGAPAGSDLLAWFEKAVAGVTGGGDTRAGAMLGIANVRYVVVAPGASSEALSRALAEQPALEPLPSAADVYRVRSWLPRAAVVEGAAGERLLATGDAGDTSAMEEQGLARAAPGTYRGSVRRDALLVLGEATSSRWRALGPSGELPRVAVAGVNAWRLDGAGTVTVAPAGVLRHRVAVAAQLLAVLALVSLALRPPRFTLQREERRRGGALPRQLIEREREVTS